MAALMHGDRVAVESSAALPVAEIMKSGVRQQPDVGALATRSDRDVSVLAWNYHDDDVASPDSPVHLILTALPTGARRGQVHHYRIDREHSNAYTVWQRMGSPQEPTPEQYGRLESSGKLQLLEPPTGIPIDNGKVDLKFSLPRQGVSLVQISWE